MLSQVINTVSYLSEVEICKYCLIDAYSDHAMSRCLIHGAYSHPVHSDCWSGFKPSYVDIPIKMCMVVSVCDVSA